MFCENCGAKMEDGDLFCGECGHKVALVSPNPVKKETPKKTVTQKQQATTEQKKPAPKKVTKDAAAKKPAPKKETKDAATKKPAPKKVTRDAATKKPAQKKAAPKKGEPKKKVAKKSAPGQGFSPKAKKIIIAQVVVLVALLGIFYYMGSRSGDAGTVANQFVEDYNNHNWEKIYPLYHFEEDTFINADTFAATMDQSSVQSLSVPTGGYLSGNQYVYTVNNGDTSILISVGKSAKKTYLFFDKYEVTSVSSSNTMIDTVSMEELPGTTMKIDGVKVENTTDSDIFSIRLFEGTHKISFDGDNQLFSKDSYTFTTQESPLSKVEYSSEAKTAAANALKGYLPSITEAVIKNKDDSTLSNMFTSLETAQTYGGSLCRYTYYVGSDAKQLKDIKLTTCEAQDYSNYKNVTDGIPIAVAGTRDYSYKGWSGAYEQKTCTIQGTAYMIQKDGKWLIDSVTYY